MTRTPPPGFREAAFALVPWRLGAGPQRRTSAPERIAALIIQNADVYEDQLGPKYDALKAYWATPTPEGRSRLAEAVSEEGFRTEFVGEADERLVERISPDLWKLAWSVMNESQRREVSLTLMEGLPANRAWFPTYQGPSCARIGRRP